MRPPHAPRLIGSGGELVTVRGGAGLTLPSASPAAGWAVVPPEIDLLADLRSGIARQEFVPFYQPILKLDTGELLGFECLARWSHPGLGTIGPDRFIPIAEESGNIAALSFALLAQACRDARAWPAPLTLSVNISPVQLLDPDLPLHLLRLLHGGGIAPGRLIVELTESRAVADMPSARRVLTSLRNAGIKVMLDDFGVGNASLLCLHELPFDGLKVDRSFLSALDSISGRTIIRSIIDLTRNLGMTAVIEGVERREQAELLSAMGYESAQGFLFGRAMPAPAALQMIANEAPRRRSAVG